MDVYKERQKDTDTKGVFQMESNGKVALLHMYSKIINLITVEAKQPEPFGLHVTCVHSTTWRWEEDRQEEMQTECLMSALLLGQY